MAKSKNIKKKSSSNKTQQQRKLIHISQGFQGPIPPPQILQQYEQIVPGAAERILKMAENQSKHRHTMEKKIINANISNEKKGLNFGFIIGLFAITVGLICTFIGQPLPGSFIGGGGVIGLVLVFVYGSKNRTIKTKK